MIDFDGTDLFDAHQVSEHVSHLDSLLAFWFHSLDALGNLLVAEWEALFFLTHLRLLLHLLFGSEEPFFSKSIVFMGLRVQLSRRDQGN